MAPRLTASTSKVITIKPTNLISAKPRKSLMNPKIDYTNFDWTKRINSTLEPAQTALAELLKVGIEEDLDLERVVILYDAFKG